MTKDFNRAVLSVATDLKKEKHTDAFIIKIIINMLNAYNGK